MALRIAIGAHYTAYDLKQAVAEFCEQSDLVSEVVHIGATSADDEAFPFQQAGIEVAEKVASGEVDRGLVFCGNGLGVMLSANTVDGVNAVTAHDLLSVRTCLETNDAKVLCMGSRVIAHDHAIMLVEEYLKS